jgi:hypothetical protein
MREFAPPVRPSVVRSAFGIVMPLVVLLPMLALYPVLFATHGVTYRISNGTLTVETADAFSGSRTVKLADVTDVRVVALGRGRRVAGTALPGYCGGRFEYPGLGAVWQATDCGSTAVVLRARSEALPIVLTPPDPATFVEDVRTGREGSVTLAPAKSGLRFVVLGVLGAALLATLMASALAFLGPKKMRYVVREGALEVHTLFGKKRFAVAGARARVHRPSRMWRVGGTGLPGYFTGLFREEGKNTRVYATDLGGEVVLLEGEARVIVSPIDRAGFLRALAAEGASVDTLGCF